MVVEAADEAADEAGETAAAAGADAAISPVEVAVGVVILPDAGVVELVLALEVDLGMMLSLLAARALGGHLPPGADGVPVGLGIAS